MLLQSTEQGMKIRADLSSFETGLKVCLKAGRMSGGKSAD